MNQTVIVINGAPRSGKSTFVKMAKRHFSKIHHGSVAEYSSMDIIKKIASRYFGWKKTKEVADRKMLSDMKDIAIEYNDLPFKWLREEVYKQFGNWNKKVIFLHVREPQEIEKLRRYFTEKTNYSFLSLFISNSKAEEESKKFRNTGDSNVKDYPYDVYIPNEGTLKDFRNKAKDFCNILINTTEIRKSA